METFATRRYSPLPKNIKLFTFLIMKINFCKKAYYLLSLFFEKSPITITIKFFLNVLDLEKIIIGKDEIANLSLVDIIN